MQSALRGTPASPGIVIGPVHLLRWEVPEVGHRIIPDEDVGAELQRFRNAVDQARSRLHQVRASAERHAGPEEAAIFDVQLSILGDRALTDEVESYINQNISADKAFDVVMNEWRRKFARHEQSMVRERVSDLVDVQIRLLTVLLGLPDHDPVDVPKGAGAILVTHDLTPSLTVQLDPEAISAIATDAGTRTSHVAILARSLGLPAVVGLKDAADRLVGGQRVVLDGTAGVLIVDPSDAEEDAYRRRAAQEVVDAEELRRVTTGDAMTTDGTRVTLRANVDLPEEADLAARSGAEGVGLMRTEYLVLNRAAMPDEDEQYRSYKRVVEAFGGKPVVIRTFDIGGDKLPVGGFPSEANPFLGWRAIRMCLDQPELFKTQLRALLRASLHGDVRILLPLIVTADEIEATRALLDEAAGELAAAGVPHRADVPLGAMIETPAAAVSADTLARLVSFFSIGTNDLVQYTLAVDRGNVNLSSRFTPLHPAVLRLIQHVVQVGERSGVEVSVCGEMASEPVMVFALLGLGVRQFSVSPRAVPLVKRVIGGVSIEIATEAASAALSVASARDAEDALRRRLHAAFGDAPFLRDGLLPSEGGSILPDC